MDKSDEWITLRKAADITGKTPAALRKLIQRGKLKQIKKIPDTEGGKWHLHRDELTLWAGHVLPACPVGQKRDTEQDNLSTMDIGTFLQQQKEWMDERDKLRDGLMMYQFKFEELDRRIKLLPAPPEAISDRMERQTRKTERARQRAEELESQTREKTDEIDRLKKEKAALAAELEQERGKSFFDRLRELFFREV